MSETKKSAAKNAPAQKGKRRATRRGKAPSATPADVSVILSLKTGGASTGTTKGRNARAKKPRAGEGEASSSNAADANAIHGARVAPEDYQARRWAQDDVLGAYRRGTATAMSDDILVPEEVGDDERLLDESDEEAGGDRDEEVPALVPVPFLIAPSRNVKSAAEQHREEVAMQLSGSEAAKRLYAVRHGEFARKNAMSAAGHESKRSKRELDRQFERGVRTLADTSSQGDPPDLTKKELFEALCREPAYDVNSNSVRNRKVVSHVELRLRANEEEHLRAPYYPGERQCSAGIKCMGNFASSCNGFTLVEYNSRVLNEHRALHNEDRSMDEEFGDVADCVRCRTGYCAMCQRYAHHLEWCRHAAQNCAVSENHIPEMLPQYTNLIGPGEYDAMDCLQCQQSIPSPTIYPVVIYSNVSFRVGARKMPDGRFISDYKQVLTVPSETGFRDGRA